MHRTEATNLDNVTVAGRNLFKNGPPGTAVGADMMNAFQEEICNVIVKAGLTLQTAATEDWTQLWQALFHNLGVQPATFSWNSATQTDISACKYLINGNDPLLAYTDSAITFTFGPGGSNAGSDAVVADTWTYVCLDTSVIEALVDAGNPPALSANCFLNSNSSPGWVGSKGGYYIGDDRVIFAQMTESGVTNLSRFMHQGRLVTHAYPTSGFITIFSGADIDLVWTNYSCSPGVPDFGVYQRVLFYAYNTNNTATLISRLYGRTPAMTAHQFILADSGDTNAATSSGQTNWGTVDPDQDIEVVAYASDADVYQLSVVGWEMPIGL